MAVRIKIHETYIQKVAKGQKATIVVDAFPERKLKGDVIKVAMLPDSQNRWVNPDLKVYQTTVSIDGSHTWLKPGMSAKVEILVKQLKDVVYVPVQAVTEINKKQFCNVLNGDVEMRGIIAGDFNDQFIEIRSGLKEGEKVLLRAPARSYSEDSTKRDGKKDASSKDKPAPNSKTNSSTKPRA